MSRVELLPFARWRELENIFDEQFNAMLPEKEVANILAKCAVDGSIKSFAVAETIIRIGQFHTISREKGENAPLEFLRYLEKRIPKGASVIAIDDNGRFGGLCEKFGMYQLKGIAYRRDF